jgi:feruloyl-CoA synthase
VKVERRGDGALVLRSPIPLAPHARAVGEWLIQWAGRRPEQVFLAERAGEGWRTYGQTLDTTRRIGPALLDRGLDAGRNRNRNGPVFGTQVITTPTSRRGGSVAC